MVTFRWRWLSLHHWVEVCDNVMIVLSGTVEEVIVGDLLM